MIINNLFNLIGKACVITFVIITLFNIIRAFLGIKLQRMLVFKNQDGRREIPLDECPFCGKNVVGLYTVTQIDENGTPIEAYRMVCDEKSSGCGCSTGTYINAIDAVEAWNKRSYRTDI